MKNDWNDLQVFLALDRGRTARDAAKTLGCSHSTVLRRIESFEKRMGTRLFDRTPDGFQVTETGKQIQGQAQQIEIEMLELKRHLEGNDNQLTGPIRLTVPPPIAQYLLLPIMIAFQEEYPLIEIEQVVTYAYTDLSRREADTAIRFTDSPDEHFIARQLPLFNDAIYASTDYIKEHWSNDATGEPEWIGWPDKKLFKTRIKKTPFAKAGIAWVLPSMTLQSEAGKLGMGMVLLPTIVGENINGLSRVPNNQLYPVKAAWIMRHPDLRRLERARVFTDYLASKLSSHTELHN